MVNWEDGELVTPAKVNEDGTIAPAVYNGNTPLSAYNLNKMQSDLQEDADNKIENISKTYKNSNIVGPTCEGFGKIHKLYGKTEEVGSGEKSPSNPYELECVADSGQVEITSTDGTNTSNKVISCKPLCCLKDADNNIIAQDYIDFDRQKIHRELGYLVLDGSDDENWIMQTDSSIVQNTVQTFIYNKTYDGIIGLYRAAFNCNRFKSQIWSTGINLDEEFISNVSSNQAVIGIKIKKSRLSSLNADGLKAWLRNNPLIIIFKLSQSIEEDIDITNSIVQYQNQTTISNSDGAEMEIELTNNKAISSINKNIAELQDSTNKLKEIYSTEEKVVGKWIDGKKLYRKVIVSNGNVGEEVAINHNISNFRQATDIRATATSMGPLTYTNNNNKYNLIVTSINSTSIVAKIGNAFGDWNIYFTLEYTKTTD